MIRRATIEDARAIALVHTCTWQAAYRHVFPAEALDAISVDAREERWRANLAECDAFVAEQEGRVVGG